ncbi:MAG: sensor histidine kinase, partial [Cyclobacteriaceae bacterium]
WIGTEGGVNRLVPGDEPDQHRFVHYQHDAADSNSLSDNFIWHITGDKEGNLWVATARGLNKYDAARDRFINYFPHPEPESGADPASNLIGYLLADDQGVLWVGTERGLYAFDQEEEKFERVNSIPEVNIVSMTTDQAGRLWLGSFENGLFRYDRETQKVARFNKSDNNPTSLTDNWVRALLVDNSGALWAGTYGAGISIYDPKRVKFHHYKQDPNNINSLNNNILWSIYENPKGILWLGTMRGGLNKYDREKEQFTHYPHDPGDPNSLSHNDVRSVIRDRAGDLWIATWGGGVNRMVENPNGSVRFVHYRHDPRNPRSLSNDRAWILYEDRQGVIWVGTNGGISSFDPAKEAFTNYSHDPEDPFSLSGNSIRSIGEDKAGNLWMGAFSGGINRFDRETKQFISYRRDKSTSDQIGSLYIDDDGVFWMGTHEGFNRMSEVDSGQPVFRRYTTADGLPNDVVYGMLEDDQGHLWLSTNNGLSRFNKQTEVFRNFSEADGLQNKEFNHGALFENAQGEMFFGGVSGFNAFFPDEVKDNPFVPPVVITDFRVLNELAGAGSRNGAGKIVTTQAVPYSQEMLLSHRDYFFSFEFAALNYTLPEKNQYAYKMEGFDEDWIQAGTRKFATYTNLDPGNYIFRVKASNNDGVWNEEGTALNLTITPPWWATWWAYLFYGLAVVGLIWGYFQYRINVHQQRLKQKETELRAQTAEAEAKAIAVESEAEIERVKVEERERLRKQNSRDFHDELGHKLTKISMFLELAKRQKDDQPDLNKYLNKIEENTKDLSGGMRDFIWVLDPEKDTVYDTLLRLKDFGDHLFDSSGISFELLGLEDSLKKNSINSETRRHTVMLFKEAMNNCLKYANCSKAWLKVTNDSEVYTISFSDDGEGFKLNGESQGYGLENMKSRSERIKATLNIDSQKNVGTCITLQIPHMSD